MWQDKVNNPLSFIFYLRSVTDDVNKEEAKTRIATTGSAFMQNEFLPLCVLFGTIKLVQYADKYNCDTHVVTYKSLTSPKSDFQQSLVSKEDHHVMLFFPSKDL